MSALTEKGEAELRRFGWELGPEFERRYVTDPWVFNLVNALEVVAAQRDEAVELLTGVLSDDEAARFDAVAFLARLGRDQ